MALTSTKSSVRHACRHRPTPRPMQPIRPSRARCPPQRPLHGTRRTVPRLSRRALQTRHKRRRHPPAAARALTRPRSPAAAPATSGRARTDLRLARPLPLAARPAAASGSRARAPRLRWPQSHRWPSADQRSPSGTRNCAAPRAGATVRALRPSDASRASGAHWLRLALPAMAHANT